MAASVRRLSFAANPTVFHPDDVVAALGKGTGLEGLRAIAQREPSAEWERDLFAALSTREADARIALVNEQLTELDLRLQRWARVPRVCASVATSVGILLGTLVLRRGLAEAAEIDEKYVWSILNDAISVVAFGIVGTAFCIAAHAHARRLTRVRLEATDRMIEKLETAAGSVERKEHVLPSVSR